MPLLINKAARLIDINLARRDPKTGKVVATRYRLMPAGKPVEVPDDAMKLPYTKAKIAKGEIAVHVASGKTEAAKDEQKAGKEDGK